MKSSSHNGETDGWKSGFGGLWGIRSLLLDRIGRGLTCWIINVASQAGGWLAEGADTSRVMSWLVLERHPSSSQLIILRRRSRRSRARTFARMHERPAGSGGLSCISTLRAKSDRCKNAWLMPFAGNVIRFVEMWKHGGSLPPSDLDDLSYSWFDRRKSPPKMHLQWNQSRMKLVDRAESPITDTPQLFPALLQWSSGQIISGQIIIWALEQSQSTEHCCKKKKILRLHACKWLLQVVRKSKIDKW